MMPQPSKTQQDRGDGALLERSRARPQRPPRYRVVMINDDYTPMEFVVEVLQQFFQMPNTKAVNVMLQVHQSGRGVCGMYSRDIAESKVRDVLRYARSKQHPLLCQIEAVSGSRDAQEGDDNA